MSDPPRDRRREPLVVVAIAENGFTAAMLREQLAEAGIRALVRDQHSVVLGPLAGGNFGHEVLVLAGDADRATAVIGEGQPPAPLPPPALPTPERHRPGRRRRRWW
jgi:hypothetical protein